MRKLAMLSLGVCWLAVVIQSSQGQNAQDEGKAILEKAITAHGGDKVLAGVKAVQIKGKGELHVMEMKIPMALEVFSQMPDRFKAIINLDIMNMNIEVVQCFDGKKGWTQTMGKVEDLPADQEKDIKSQLYTEKVTSLLSLREKGFKVSPLGEVKVEGKDAIGLLVSHEGQPDVNLYFDKATNLLTKAEFRTKDVGTGLEVTQEKLYLSYKKQPSGYQAPTKMIVRNDGKLLIDLELSELRVVERHDDSIFARP